MERRQTPSRRQADERKQTRAPEGRSVRIIPLGGVGEVGKNATVVEYDGDIVLVDAGVKFPEEEQHGVDLVIPDVSYVRNRLGRLRAIVLTHGHEDHIGGLPYLLPELATRDKPIPIYGSALTLGFVRAKLQERNVQKYASFHTIEQHTHYQLGNISRSSLFQLPTAFLEATWLCSTRRWEAFLSRAIINSIPHRCSVLPLTSSVCARWVMRAA